MIGETYDFAICVSTALEGEGLPSTIGGRSIALIETGVGPVNAAFALTRFLSTHRAAAVIACGVGGAYPGSGLAIGLNLWMIGHFEMQRIPLMLLVETAAAVVGLCQLAVLWPALRAASIPPALAART